MAEQKALFDDADQNVAYRNTDREIWRKGDGDGNGMSYYEPSIHVTERGEIGINVGGLVFVKPVEDWHGLAKADLRSMRFKGWRWGGFLIGRLQRGN